MERFDRLTTLMRRFDLQVTPTCWEKATLVVISDDGNTGIRAILLADPGSIDFSGKNVVFAANIEWGGSANPLIGALPPVVKVDLGVDEEGRALVSVLRWELDEQRCGAGSIVNRLCEVLMVRIMRAQIEAGTTEPGLLAGLADPRLSRAIVSMHDRPGHDWHNEDLAQIAGLSLSRFLELFNETVGETPIAYLRRWRLTLARQDVSRGDRIDAVSRRYGYSSPEGFTRAFKKHYGTSPVELRVGKAA